MIFFPLKNKTDDYRAYKAVDAASTKSYITEVRAPTGSECSTIPRLHPVPRQSMKIFSTGYIILISYVKRKFFKTYFYFIYKYSSLKAVKFPESKTINTGFVTEKIEETRRISSSYC